MEGGITKLILDKEDFKGKALLEIKKSILMIKS